MKFGSKVLADEINSRHDKHSNATTSKKTTQSTYHPSSPVEQGRQTPTEQPAMDTEEIATRNVAPNTERKPPKRRASEAGVVRSPNQQTWTPKSSTSKNDMERLNKAKSRRGHKLDKAACKAKNREAVMNLAKQNDDKFTATLGATLSTMRQENKARLARVEERIDENVNALGAMLHRTSTEKEVREFPQEVSKNMRWKKVLKTRIVQQNQSHVPSCNLKQKDRNGFLRLTKRQQYTIEQRTIRFKTG